MRADEIRAPSCRVPDGSPCASRSILPSSGSGVSSRDPRRARSAARVHPGPVAVAVGQVDGPVGDDRSSSRSLVGVPPGNTSIAQPPPRIHGDVGMAPRRRPSIASRYSSARRELVQVALEHVQAAADRVDVRVLEPRQEHRARAGRRPRCERRRGRGSRRRSPTATMRPARTATARAQRPRRVHRVDGAVDEDQVGRRSVGTHDRSLPVALRRGSAKHSATARTHAARTVAPSRAGVQARATRSRRSSSQ